MTNTAIHIEEIDLTFQAKEAININAQHFLDEIIKVNKLPFNQGEYYFTDDLWDFSPYKKNNIPSSYLKFNFSNCCEEFRDELKKYVLFKLLERVIKVQSIQQNFMQLYMFFNKIKEQNYFSIIDVGSNFVRDYLKDIINEKSYATYMHHRGALKDFYMYYSANFTNILTTDFVNLFNDIDYKRVKIEKLNKKTPSIPQDYYNKFLSATIQIIDDSSAPEMIRATAALYLILSQTGLRISECLALEIDTMESIPIFNGETAYYLRYKTWKRVKGDNVFHWQRTYVNELTKKGYDFLVKQFKQEREMLNTNYLYLNKNNLSNLPLSLEKLSYLRLCYFIYLDKYFPTINLPENTYKDINNIKFDGSHYDIYKHVNTIAIPKNHQFRVYVCTDLYNKGVPLKYIEKFMAHLSHEMADYYVRPNKQNPQENMDFSLDTLQKIVTGETKLLGGNGGLQAKINEFIEKNNYNVETDLQAICEKLAENIPIRQKTGGVCIKSSMLRECSKDSKTNEFYCAYGVCPNIFHFYYMADVSYRQAKELSETIEINRNRGLVRQVEKETNMLHHIVKVKLIPELDELKNVINKKGVQAVMMEYPDLKDIIENLDAIYETTEKWLRKECE